MSAVLIGWQDLAKTLDDLSDAVAKRALEQSVERGAVRIEGAARDGAPSDVKPIVARMTEVRQPHRVEMRVGLERHRWRTGLGVIAEYGAPPHTITIPRRSAKQVMASETEVYGTRVRHPGAPARPFLRPAWDHHKEAAAQEIRDELTRRITAAAKRVWARRARRGTG